MKTLKVLFILMFILYLSNSIVQADFIFGEPTKVPNVNSAFSDGAPQISRDGLELYMSSSRDGGVDKIWVSKRATIDAPWSIPIKIDTSVNSDSSQNFPSLSSDGLELYFSESQGGILNPNGYGGPDIWVMTRKSKDEPWGEQENPGPNINTASDEFTPCISANGLELYFSSDVSGGLGMEDIYVVTRQSKDDSWGESVNLGPNVNINRAEITPFISPDGLLLFFSRGYSAGHIYVCRRTSTRKPWGPAEFFEPINSGTGEYSAAPGDAEYHACFADGDSTIYFTRGSDVFATDYNVWQVEVTPIVDFNTDEIIDVKDIVTLTEHWGEYYSLYDIGPLPLGDEKVDAQDLIVLTNYISPIPIAHWALDEVEGNIAHDKVNNNNDIIMGNPFWKPTGGKVDGALELDGLSSSIFTTFGLDPSKGPFSIFAWVKGGAPGQVIISLPFGADLLLADTSAGNLMTELKDSDSLAGPLLSETVITDEQWHRIGLVWDGLQRTLYVDSKKVAEDKLASLEGYIGGMYIGVGKDFTSDTFFSGMMDDIRIYDVALTPEQIAGLSQ